MRPTPSQIGALREYRAAGIDHALSVLNVAKLALRPGASPEFVAVARERIDAAIVMLTNESPDVGHG